MIRIQIFYSKAGAFRYTGNLDMHKAWERIFRRASLPLAYSQGFHPQPRLNQANPLPLGLIGRNELIEAWLDNEQWEGAIQLALEKSLPPGIAINTIQEVPLNAPPPQTQIIAADYRIEIPPEVPLSPIQEGIQLLLESKEYWRERRGKPYNLRPLIIRLALESPGAQSQPRVLHMQLAAGQATGRPDEVLAALGLNPASFHIERSNLVFQG
ncbi:MAG: DUF2344 domain-containing protein [Anaerolineaceae bacterium]|nr:DUF2344 domain-containing protein [Anaerolineaceae bacterium]